MKTDMRGIVATLTLLAGILISLVSSAFAGPNTPSTGGASTGPSPIRPEFTRPGGTPGTARESGAPERFWDPAQAKKKKKRKSSMPN